MNDIADRLRQRTLDFALGVIAFCRQLPDTWVERELGKQLLRAGMGVAGNCWSACRGRSDKEFVAKIGVAADEADESVLWLTALDRSGIRSNGDGKSLLGEGNELRAILAKSHKTARENRKKKKREARRAPRPATH
jgi:four helix bundle protein